MSSDYETVEQVIVQLEKNERDFASLRNLLRLLRQTKLRRSELVTYYGPRLLKGFGSKLADIECTNWHKGKIC